MEWVKEWLGFHRLYEGDALRVYGVLVFFYNSYGEILPFRGECPCMVLGVSFYEDPYEFKRSYCNQCTSRYSMSTAR